MISPVPIALMPLILEDERAHILLAGHGTNQMYLLTPTGDASQFEYTMDTVVDGRAVIPFI